MNRNTSVLIPPAPLPAQIPLHLALGVLIVLWFGYTALQAPRVQASLGRPLAALLEFIPGLLGFIALTMAGFSRTDRFLLVRPISLKGLIALALTLPLFALVVLTGTLASFDPLAMLVYAPASALAQELFFRAALLPVFFKMFTNRPVVSLVLHSALFGLWHVGPIFAGAPVWAVLAVMAVPFLCGLAWGWQVIRDKTLVWVLAYHTLLLMINSMFVWN